MTDSVDTFDEDLEAMKKRVAEMEAEAEKLRQMQAEDAKEMNLAPAIKKNIHMKSDMIRPQKK
jgi:hypothetical protein